MSGLGPGCAGHDAAHFATLDSHLTASDRIFRMGWFDYLNRIKHLTDVGDAWRKPSLRVVDERDIRGEGHPFRAAGFAEAVAVSRGPASRQRPR